LYQKYLELEIYKQVFLRHFAATRKEVNAECIAAFRSIAKETGRSYGKFSFLPNSILCTTPIY
jgi:hypothetical protein